ncbi:MAG: Crp/Fnr family transcriptional regulator [Pseudomonadota bacterium]
MTQHATDNRIDIPSLLVRLPLFQALTQEQVAHVSAHTRSKRLPKGEMLFQKGDLAHGFYVIVFGQVKLAFPSSNGNEKVVEIIGPKQSFGEAAVFAQRPYPVFAQALADTLLLHIGRDVIFELLESDTSFARHMLAGLAMRMHSLIQDVESYSLRSSAQRVIGYLLQHCPNEGCEGSIEITLPTSKQIIASRLNLTPETLSRILHDLAEAKLIEMQGKRISIGNLQRLREYDF